jgi:anaerobic magnesium-protoporphyrin IX monomethyl ester cyclase
MQGARPWIALVGPEIEENLGLRYLASSLIAAGFGVEILPFSRQADFGGLLDSVLGAEEPPLAVAISLAFQWRAMDCLALAIALRERGYRGHITAGGHFGHFAWHEILSDFPELDTICRHEAEETIVALALALRDDHPLDGIRGLALRDGRGPLCTEARWPPDLAQLPWPDRRGEPIECLGHRVASLVASRGCYARCAFCCIAAWHAQSPSGVKLRLRPVADVADEIAWLHHEMQVEIFIFHDDNFFLPSPAASLERILALADELDARRVGRVATVVKARPNDVTKEVFRAMRERLGNIRLFLGIETDAAQGLRTLARGVRSQQNHAALHVLDDLGLYVCFNLLLFDPDTSLDSLRTNIEFMEANAHCPSNFGRAELYAGTPLLERMLAEGRCRGDYLGWDYALASPEVQRVFDIVRTCFHERNFAPGAAANRLMGTRFDVEVGRFFHPERFQLAWLDEARQLSRRLAQDSVAGLRAIIKHVAQSNAVQDDGPFGLALTQDLHRFDRELLEAARELEERVRASVGRACVHSRPSSAPRTQAR